MMGRQTVDQSQLFYLFNLERRIPERHLLRRINPTVTRILAEFREKLLIIGYCYGIRFERRLCEEVELHPIAGSAASISTTRFPTTRLSRSIAMAGSATAIYFAKYSRRWCGRA
jgi:hypothetical protein